jgi:hypothetical protein
MSLAAVPAYFLARRVLQRGPALAAAALAVALPSLAYSGTLMTENVFYPLFLCYVLALVSMLEGPTPRRQLLVLGLCVVLFLTRAQAVALTVAALTAPLALAWIERGRPRRLAVFAPLYGVTAVGALAVIVFEVARGHSPTAALGNYSVTGSGGYQAWPSFRWLLYHVAELDLALFVAPFAALIVVVAAARHLDRRLRIFAAVAATVSAWLVLEVAVFASRYSERVEERNLFYLMPLFLIALLAWIERGQPRPPRATVAAAVVAAALPGVLPFSTLLGGVSSESDTVGLRPWWYVRDVLAGDASVPLIVVITTLTLGAAFLWLPRRYAPWLPVVVVAGFLATWLPLELWHYSFRDASVGALYQGIRTGDRTWIDDKVGSGARVAALWTNRGNPFSIWENEFFNRSVQRVYDLGAALPGAEAMPESPVTIDRETGILRTKQGGTIDSQYVLTDNSMQLLGKAVARDVERGMVLYRVTPPARTATRIVGLWPNDTWSKPDVEWFRANCRGGQLVVHVHSDPTLFPRGQQIVAKAGGAPIVFTLRPKQFRTLVVPIRGRCDVRFTVTPTKIPGNGDTRELGAHFDRIEYRPSR